MHPSARKWLYFLAAAGLLAAGAMQVGALNRERVSAQLVGATLPEAAQPGMMMGPLLAVGRAPLVDYLWLRATKLKDEGRYFDAYQLAETIGRLQPRFAAVWAFNAWNMAYNISVTFRTPEERWRWVRNGIELLRDQGIPRNPRNTQMYKELAWIFFHKIGDYVDDQHWYYKLQFALLMEDILGPGAEHDYAALAAAPAKWSELAADPAVADVLRQFAAEHEDLSRPGVYLGLLTRDDVSREIKALLGDSKTADARRRIELFWRAKRLREEVRLDPQRIIALRQAYGPIDFRLAEAHALYWASLGVEVGSDSRTSLDIEKLNTDRIELFCLQNFFRHGRMVMSPAARQGEAPLMLPDVRFAEPLRKAFLAISKRYLKKESEGPIATNFQSAMNSFMREAVMRFNEAGQIAKSREYFDWLVKNYPADDYKKGYEAFIKKEWLDDQNMPERRIVQFRIMNLIARGAQQIAYADYDAGAANIEYARKLWAVYEKQVVTKTRHLPTFRELYGYVVHDMGPRMRPESYDRLLQRTGFQRATSQPTTRAAPAGS